MEAISICIGRKGSKGLPGKNTMSIRGNPMGFYSMNAAKNSKYIKNMFISTDDPILEKLGKKLNHKVLYRPKELANSSALGEDVFAHSYSQIIATYPDLSSLPIALLFCNAPTILSSEIDKAIEILYADETADSVVTVSKLNMWSPLRARKLDNNNEFLLPFVPFETFGDPENLNCDRDSQGDVLFANMSLSVVKPKCLLEMSNGLLPQKWMGRNIKPLYQEFGCDVDFSWQVPIIEHWLDLNNNK